TGARAGTEYGMEPSMYGKCRRYVVMRHVAKAIAFIEVEHPKLGPADASCARQHCLEHRLQFARRAADDLQDLRGRRLLLQRLPQLIEQASILDGNDGLLGKAREERDLLVGERANFLAVYIDGADQRPFVEHRHKNNCANPQEIDEFHGSYIALAIWRSRAKIIDLHHLLRSNHFSM